MSENVLFFEHIHLKFEKSAHIPQKNFPPTYFYGVSKNKEFMLIFQIPHTNFDEKNLGVI